MRQKLAAFSEHRVGLRARNSFINYRGQFSGGYDAMMARARVIYLQIDPATQSVFILGLAEVEIVLFGACAEDHYLMMDQISTFEGRTWPLFFLSS